VAGQLELVTHSPQTPPVTSQKGVGPEQSSLPLHWTQVPVEEQARAPGKRVQSVSLVHAEQVWSARLQTGASAVQFELVTHSPQTPPVTSQKGVGPEQSSLPLHWTQVPVEEQAGAPGDVQSPSDLHPSQLPWELQIGAPVGQSEFARHSTQTPPRLTSQRPWAPEQSSLPLHATQLPVPALQTGVAEKATQSVSVVQSPQVWVASSQTGFSALQSELVTQATQVPPFKSRSHSGVGPVQRVWEFASHWTQLPAPSLQTGVAE